MALPTWLDQLPDAPQQRALDSWAIEDRGIPGLRLMERAGGGLARRVAELVPDGPIVVVCGSGNNGGDGLVAARLLREQGREVRVLLLADPVRLSDDAKANLALLPGDPPALFAPELLQRAAGIVDAILGTGFHGLPRNPAADAITAINDARAADGKGPVVIACDIPSGVDASSGEAEGVAVRADATVTFHAGKPGIWIAPGKHLVGEPTVIDIGIPSDDAQPQVSPIAGLIGDSVLAEIPRRDSTATKFTAGSVLVCGGSRGLTGAVVMASTAAARAGAGYVTVAVPDTLVEVMQMKLMEVMSAALPERGGDLAAEAVDAALERVARVDSLVLGPGLGRTLGSQEFARELARRASVPLVLDADGLNAHAGAGHLESLTTRAAPTVITPHAGELGRLLGVTSSEIELRRLYRAREAAGRAHAVVVLKGDDTIVAEPSGRVAISPGGAPMLATAGTGDVLSGIIGALLAKGMDAFTAASAAVILHLRAGRIAAARIGGTEGVLAGDVITAIPPALAESAEVRNPGAG